MPRFSPDGRWIAFTGEYQGNRDVYVIPASGGPAKRLTIENHGVDPDIVVDDSPADWMQGRDIQLQAAVDYLLGEMKKHPAALPPPPPALPAYPSYTGSGTRRYGTNLPAKPRFSPASIEALRRLRGNRLGFSANGRAPSPKIPYIQDSAPVRGRACGG
jgi:hypothetical protein